MTYYKKNIEETLNELNTTRKGMPKNEVDNRLTKYGKNILKQKEQKSIFTIISNQLKEVMVIILFAAALISALLHEYIDSIVILIIVFLNTIIGFWQEYKAEKAMAALKKMTIPDIKVLRNGNTELVPANLLVPGDIVILETGNIIPADGRLIESANLKIQESVLTGESEPVEKSHEFIANQEIPLGDRKNMVYRGTIVTYGRGITVITNTGMKTEIGKIAGMLHSIDEEKTPLQKRLSSLGKILALIAFFLILIVGGISLLKGNNLKETFIMAVSMAVAAIPEGLPAVVTIALALGAGRMLKKNTLIRHLPAVETLGSVTVICSDKTGTITENKMTVNSIILPDKLITAETINKNNMDIQARLLAAAGTLCNDSEESTCDDGSIEIIGDPTETAIVKLYLDNIESKKILEKKIPRISEKPFDSERKMMTTIHLIKEPGKLDKFITINKYYAFTKGSVDEMLDISDKIIVNNKIADLSENKKKDILEKNREMAEKGIRVLGFAYKPATKKEAENPEAIEKDLIFIGMCGMTDPVKKGVKEAVHICMNAGIRPVMITGDHPVTASAIAGDLDFPNSDKHLTGNDLNKLQKTELEKESEKVSVYARVSPKHKMDLIQALRKNGHIVSMTGDGVNDAPALKAADIGVAMGITGTEVAKDASDMVLLDDNFTTIVSAVKEGRTIYDNIKKFVKYILTGNFAEIAVMLFGPLLGLPLPLLPIQILWINLVTDGAPGIAMGYEKSEKDIMQRKPNKPGESIFAHGVGIQIILFGILTSIICIAVGLYYYSRSRAWQTIIFTTLTFCQMQLALCLKSNKESSFSLNVFSNRMLIFSVLATFGLQLLIIYIPFLQNIFRTNALSLNELLVCFLASLIIVIISEIKKVFRILQ